MNTTSPTETVHFIPAGFWRRFAALIIDRIILITCWFSIEAFMGNDMFFKISLYFMVFFVYYAGLLGAAWHATVGKRLLNVYVIDKQGMGITPLRASLRFLVILVPYIPTIILLQVIFYQGPEALSHVLNNNYQKMVLQWLSIASSAFYMIFTLIWYVPIPFSKDKRGVHDRICGTQVVMGRC